MDDAPTTAALEARAHWVAADLIAYPADLLPDAADWSFELWSRVPPPGGRMDPSATNPLLADRIVPLLPRPDGIGDLENDFPALRYHRALRVPLGPAEVARVVTGAVELVARRSGGSVGSTVRTGLQLGGVLDDLYGRDAVRRVLGPTWSDGVPSLTLWAPTALGVTLQLYGGLGRGPAARDLAGQPAERIPMARAADGAWSVQGEPSWAGRAYRYEVEVWVPAVGAVVGNVVTDPYSVALTTGSTHSVLVDLTDPAFRPAQWESTPPPPVARPVDRTIYELHVRDFSAADDLVPPEHRGAYLAFADSGRGAAHLRALAEAGLNTVHLLPVFDFASVPEDRTDQLAPVGDLRRFAPDSSEQQRAVSAVAARDAFNWGYDPWHYLAPEGSYATAGNADGGARVAELRTMVGALHGLGLQVVLDQVYNHTFRHGQDPGSVLDRVVPGYYHRLDAAGRVEASTCCSNIATERVMANKLMVDAVVHWARHYRVDGFRFDLMGHHSRDTMLAVRAGLDALTLAADGVDGRAVYLYGEGWNFGEVADDRIFVQARQGNLGRTGIGTFSDRLRDAVQGGSAANRASLFQQGFATGLATDPNDDAWTGPHEQEALLRRLGDLVRLGLAGNLRDLALRTSDGVLRRGDEIDYAGRPAGYADAPDEVITYVDAHDNHTLFDLLALKLPARTSMDDRVRMAMLALATTALAQTPILWHAGTDLLRSKSLDADSYDSGDWFNAIDWSGQDNGFGRGLPPAGRNEREWPWYAALLARADLKPSPVHIARAREWARDLLRLRFSTPLLRLGDAALIREKVTFPGAGPAATPGVVLMHVDDRVGPDIDPVLDGALVVLNGRPGAVTERAVGLAGREYRLSPVQAHGVDGVVRETSWDAETGTVHVPGRTAALLVEAG